MGQYPYARWIEEGRFWAVMHGSGRVDRCEDFAEVEAAVKRERLRQRRADRVARSRGAA